MMNDSDLIDELYEGMRERADAIDAPDGLVAGVRRATRRRRAARATAFGVPVLAVAGVATAVAVGGGSSAPHLAISPSGATAPAVHARDTADIVARVKARIAGSDQSGWVYDDHSYASGQVSADGSLVDLGDEQGGSLTYIAADGAQYSRNTNGKEIGYGRLGPVLNGKEATSVTLLDTATHTYWKETSETSVPADAGPAQTPASDLPSGPSEVQQALQDGQVTQMGATTVNGTQAIALKLVNLPGRSAGLIVYVDAQTYQPVREVWVQSPAGPAVQTGVSVVDWLPATPDNIATAKADSIPAGYTKVAVPAGDRSQP